MNGPKVEDIARVAGDIAPPVEDVGVELLGPPF